MVLSRSMMSKLNKLITSDEVTERGFPMIYLLIMFTLCLAL